MCVRHPPDWVTQTDERILEVLKADGPRSPEIFEEDSRVPSSRNYINQRLTKLTRAGFTQRWARGFYRITEQGEALLAGEDFSDLPDPDAEPSSDGGTAQA